MDSLFAKHVAPAPDVVRARSVDAGAGIYLLAGRWHFARCDSGEEHALVARGALHIADLRFDRDPLEARHGDRVVRALPSREAGRALAEPSRN